MLRNECLEDLRYWVDSNRKAALRVLDLIEATAPDAFGGIGSQNDLRHSGGNVWSRWITEADRFVYEVFNDRIEFLPARYHYD